MVIYFEKNVTIFPLTPERKGGRKLSRRLEQIDDDGLSLAGHRLALFRLWLSTNAKKKKTQSGAGQVRMINIVRVHQASHGCRG